MKFQTLLDLVRLAFSRVAAPFCTLALSSLVAAFFLPAAAPVVPGLAFWPWWRVASEAFLVATVPLPATAAAVPFLAVTTVLSDSVLGQRSGLRAFLSGFLCRRNCRLFLDNGLFFLCSWLLFRSGLLLTQAGSKSGSSKLFLYLLGRLARGLPTRDEKKRQTET